MGSQLEIAVNSTILSPCGCSKNSETARTFPRDHNLLGYNSLLFSMASTDISIFHNVTCPFCGLGCDDLTVTVQKTLRVTADSALPQYCRGCYENASLQALPECRINGRTSSVDGALKEAVKLLSKAQSPLFSGLAVDVNGARAVMALADRCRATLDHVNSPAILRNTLVTQAEGNILATLSEVGNRAELIVIFGTKPFTAFPRLIEKLNLKGGRRFREKDPEFVLIGPWHEEPVPEILKQQRHRVIVAATDMLGDCIRRLSAASEPSIALRKSQSFDGALQRLMENLLTSRYSALVWTASEFDVPYAELSIEVLAKLIKKINRKTRCVGLPLSGNYGDLTFQQVCIWQSGYQTRTSYAKGYPEYDPDTYSAENMLARGDVDLLLWVSPLDPAPPPQVEIPTIVVAHPAMQIDHKVEVFIPSGIPGIDHSGHFFRSDGVVSLRLKQIRNGGLPPASELLKKMHTAIHEASYAD